MSDTGESKLERFLKSIQEYISPHDMKRLQAYTDNLADFHLVFFFFGKDFSVKDLVCL